MCRLVKIRALLQQGAGGNELPKLKARDPLQEAT